MMRTSYTADGQKKLMEYDTDAGTYVAWDLDGTVIAERAITDAERNFVLNPEPPKPIDIQGLADAVDQLLLTVLMGGGL